MKPPEPPQQLSDKEIREKKKRSLKYSVMDGAFYSAMVGFGESFLSAFAVFLQATTFQLGLLGSLPQTLGSIVELFSTRLIRFFRSRKKFVFIGAYLQGLMYIPVALVFFFGTFKVFHLILFVCLYWIFGMIVSPAWSSWMGDLIDEKDKGTYFGRRNRIAGVVTFVAFLLGGYILQNFSASRMVQYYGFAIIFGLAFISRIFSIIYLAKQHEPEYAPAKGAEFTFIDFLKQARFRNYGLFVLFFTTMNFFVYLSGPFFTPYMLNDLKFSYMTFTIVNAVSLIVKYLAMPAWGKAADRYGTRKVLSLASFMMPLVPLLWVFSTNLWYLLIVQIYSGIAWAGFELMSFSFIFDTTTPQKRATCVAYYNVLNGIMIFVGAMLGTAVVKYLPVAFFFSQYYLVFILSFAGRYLISIYFIPKLKEVKQVDHISYDKLFMQIISAMPTMGLMHRIIMVEADGLNKIEHKVADEVKKIKNGKFKI